MANKTVCVTGAAGFVASWIVSKLLQKGYTVHGTVRNPDDTTKCDHLRNLEGAADRLKLFKADVLDLNSIADAVRGCHAVFHTACPVAVKFDNPDDVLEIAIKGTKNVMEACAREKIKRVVMTSSGAAVVADPKRPADKVVDESCWSDTEACRESKDWYSLAKTESELLAWSLAREHNLDLVVICPVWVLGPVLQPTINVTVQSLKNVITGPTYGNAWFRTVDVRDVADAHVAALENPAASGRYYCFADAVMPKTVVEVTKKNFHNLSTPEKSNGQPVTGIPPSMASNKKIKDDLIQDFIPFEQMVVETIQCLQEKQVI